ncbi:MAG: hypothetical protein ACI9VR_004132 [Cognaticolwellia sp.]|jgi:hypothetical protein
MFGWFKSDPIKKIRKEISAKEEEAMQLQRNGKLREFAELTKEIEGLQDQLEALRAQAS